MARPTQQPTVHWHILVPVGLDAQAQAAKGNQTLTAWALAAIQEKLAREKGAKP